MKRFTPMVRAAESAADRKFLVDSGWDPIGTCVEDPLGHYVRFADVEPLIDLLKDIITGWEGPRSGQVNDIRYQRRTVRIEQIRDALAKAGL
jgi:hypothetical protein